ncbi:MAG TPA: amidohydrolase family protein [Gemmataceae bacterium]|nr:amidohydrolase family protein [Gemmataceae bacterium]
MQRFITSVTLVVALAACRAAADEPPIAFTNVAIETAGKVGRIDSGTLLLNGGKIEAVGKDVKIPDDAQVIDGRGKTIMPGILDPFREVSIAGATVDAAPRGVVGRGRQGGFGGRAGGGGTTFTRVADNFYPYEPVYRSLVRSGLTGLNLVTTGYGESAVIRLTPDQPDNMLVSPDGVLFTAVTNDATTLDIVRTALETADRARRGLPAAAPPANAGAGDSAPAPPAGRRGGGGRRFGGRGQGGGGFPAASLKAWQAIYEGKAPLFANAASAAAILHLLDVVKPYKDIKLVILAPSPALYETLEQLAGRPIRVIVRPGLSLKPNTRDRVDMASVLYDAGIEFSFAQPTSVADLLATQDFPLFAVAYSVRCGLPRKVALEALTARPAALLGLEKSHGTLEPTKSADLLIFSGDPLDPASQLSQVLIRGRTVYEN